MKFGMQTYAMLRKSLQGVRMLIFLIVTYTETYSEMKVELKVSVSKILTHAEITSARLLPCLSSY